MGTAAQRKKDRERGFVSAFLKLSNLPARILEEREAPDFILEVEGRSVGLEVTEVFRGSNGGPEQPRQTESVINEIILRARRVYEDRGGKPLHVSIGFHSRGEMRHVSRTEAADKLATFLLELDPPVDQVVEWRRRAIDPDALPEQIAFISVIAVPVPTMAHWWAPQAGWVAPLVAELLQPSINEKSRKIAQYRCAVPEVWPLLAIEGRSPSQLFEPSSEVPTVASPFDRTYLISTFPRTFELLPTLADA